MRILGFAILCLIGAYFHFSERPIERAPGIVAPLQPQQTDVADWRRTFERNGYRINALATFEAEALVLLKEEYTFDRGAELAPVDLALGWGPMSDTSVLEQLEISQGNRFYYWHTSEFPISRQQIEHNSANMHMIPATTEVEDRLRSIRPGNIIRISGYLADASAPDGWRWRSSLSREDTGAGACELVWVETLDVY